MCIHGPASRPPRLQKFSLPGGDLPESRPSAETATEVTKFVCPSSRATSFADSASHTRTVLSLEPVYTRRPTDGACEISFSGRASRAVSSASKVLGDGDGKCGIYSRLALTRPTYVGQRIFGI